MRLLLFTITYLLISLPLSGQRGSFGLTISNNTTGFPVTGYPDIFYSQFHPGIEALYRYDLNSGEKHRLYAQMNLGMYYHRFVQTLLQVYPSAGYEYLISDKWAAGLSLGAGYGLSFEGRNAFEKNGDGSYSPKPFWGARSQYLLAISIGGSYQFIKNEVRGPTLLFGLRTLLQGTYVSSYVPLIPINSFQLGIRFPIENRQ